MIDAPVALAFSAGLIAAFNPCGFAMLPAYVSYFLGTEGRRLDEGVSGAAAALRGLAVGAVMAVGFVVVFSVAGVMLVPLKWGIEPHLAWVTMLVGLALIPLGVALLRGFELKIKLPGVTAAAEGRGLVSQFAYGVSYALVSLSCTIAPFLAAVSGTLRTGTPLESAVVVVVYGLGMSVVVIGVTVGVAVFRNSAAAFFRKALPYVNRASGALMIVAGAYVAYYGWFEWAVTRGHSTDINVFGRTIDGAVPADIVQRWSAEISNWISDFGTVRLAFLIIGLATLAAVIAVALRPGRSATAAAPTGDGEAADDAEPDVPKVEA